MTKWRRQSGVALITALLVVALATVAAVGMAARQQLDIRRTGNLLHSEQAYTYLLGAESWARVVLADDLRNNQTDSANDDWANKPVSLVEGGMVTGTVRDAQGLFNLNSLVVGGQPDNPAIERYRHLLEALDLPVELVDPLVDWLDVDVNVRFPDGAEDQTYLLLQPPYRSANQPLADISELRLVRGYEPEIIEVLRPHVTVLPGPTPINVNTAPAAVLRSLAPQLSEVDGGNLASARAAEPDGVFKDVGSFLALPEFAGKQPPPDANAVSVGSEWFVFEGQANVGSASARLSSLLHRTSQGVQVIQRRRAFVPLPQEEEEE